MVVPHNPCNPPLKRWVAELQRDVINPNDRMRRVLPEPPLNAERICKSLKNHLMPTRLPAPLDAVTGNFKCDRSKCLIYQQHLVETGNFRSERTSEVLTIRHKMTCDYSNIVYLLCCDTCSHTQYIWETKHSLRAPTPCFTNTGPIPTQTQALMSPDISTHRTTHLQT